MILWATAPALYAQHPPISLFDKDFAIINPITGENDRKPFSTQNTCGICHDYETITSGYHFQMGWDKISDDFGVERGRPWDLSDGFMGKWYPYAFRQLAKKRNETPDEIDLTVYDFVGFSRTAPDQPPCGACHPGGAGLQFDRDGNRYDQHLRDNPWLRETPDGDYYQSNWDNSGVVEADCFVCHFRGYNFQERITQLESGNYQWAVVSATGIGIVEGSVKAGDEPTVTYNKRLFNADGAITLNMSWPPPARNCVYCHGTSDVKKRGFSWGDIHNPDIHDQQGLSCVACHTAGLDHQITKGNANISTVADELDNTIRQCHQCHSAGYLGASVPRHPTIRPSHLERIACESCHVPSLNRAATSGHEATTGELVFTTNPPEAPEVGALAKWAPVYQRRDNGVIYPFNSVLTAWWGNLDQDGILYPLFLREHAAGWKLFAGTVRDDNEDGKPEVNRNQEIIAGLEAFGESLRGNRRFRRVHPVFVKANKAFHLDEAGRLSFLDYDLGDMSTLQFSVTHNVAPARLALGANGCTDCHDDQSHFFTGGRVLDLCGSDGKPVTQANGLSFGANLLAFRINSFHQQILSPTVSLAVILVVFLIVLHYHGYGPKRIPFEPFSGEVQRFTLMERGVHLFRLISFIMLTLTGLIMAFNHTAWQELLFRSQGQVLYLHIGFGVVFVFTTLMGIVVWFQDALFESHDRDWVRIVGGYLGHKGKIPAGRFNAGQKMFYWYTSVLGLAMSVTGLALVFKGSFPLSTVFVVSTLHNLVSFILIAGVLAHAYLGTIANPGTWRVLVDGYVNLEWAEHHHPHWFKSLAKDGESEAAAEGREREPSLGTGRIASDKPPEQS